MMTMHPIQTARAALGFVRLVDSLTDSPAAAEFLAWAEAHPEIGPAMVRQPRLGPMDLNALATLPSGTLGHAFATHELERGLDPADLPVRPHHDGGSWLLAHLYETHDIWHVVTGFDTDVAGELGLQAFMLGQMPTPLPWFLLGGGFLNTALFARHEADARARAFVDGWTMGRQARPLVGVAWSERWDEPLASVREGLGVTLPAAV